MNDLLKDKNSSLLIFAKYPEAGKVKTRLASSLGEKVTVELYGCFIQDILANMKELAVPLHLYVYPETAWKDFQLWLGDSYRYIPQQGEDLGERMMLAFLQQFEQGCQKVIIIGSDSPDLPASVVECAFSGLDTHDVVIGPAVDGGYYLIGFNKETFLREAFKGITWSTENVFRDTMNTFLDAGHQVLVLTPWQDIDTVADLRELMKKSQNIDFHESKTAVYLSNHQKLITDHQ